MMDKTEEFNQRVWNMPDSQLLKLADITLKQLCRTGGSSFTMTVPPRESDCDIILAELIRRYTKAIAPKGKAQKVRREEKLVFIRKHWDKFKLLESAQWIGYSQSILLELIRAEFKYSEKTASCDIFVNFRTLYEDEKRREKLPEKNN